jgi:CheY-like chemotaxis protein
MVHATLIGPDRNLNAEFLRVLSEIGGPPVRVIENYPAPEDLRRELHDTQPTLIFASSDSVADCVELTRVIRQTTPNVPVIAIGRSPDAETLTGLINAGVREFLGAPFPECVVHAALGRYNDGYGDSCRDRRHIDRPGF